MADITNPEAVRFCNEKIRPLADKLAQAYYHLISLRDEWVANGIGSLIPDAATDAIIDGSATDGRHPITGADVSNIAAIAVSMISDYEANSSARLNEILNVAVNPQA